VQTDIGEIRLTARRPPACLPACLPGGLVTPAAPAEAVLHRAPTAAAGDKDQSIASFRHRHRRRRCPPADVYNS